jgi:hypothetical protein
MAYPTDIDDFTEVINGDTIAAAMFNTPNIAIEALEAIIGVTDTTVDTSLKYKTDNFMLEDVTKIFFPKITPPIGWTYDISSKDNVLATKSDSGAYVTTGINQGTWTQPNSTLTEANLPSHRHYVVNGTEIFSPVALSTALAMGNYNGSSMDNFRPNNAGTPGDANIGRSSLTGSGTSHNHGTTYRPYATVGIIATYTGS